MGEFEGTTDQLGAQQIANRIPVSRRFPADKQAELFYRYQTIKFETCTALPN
jgi:hypothetical protein